MDPLTFDLITLGVWDGINLIADMSKSSRGLVNEGWSVAIKPAQFGPRDVMQSRYVTRAVAASVGLYGLDPDEAYYPVTSKMAISYMAARAIRYTSQICRKSTLSGRSLCIGCRRNCLLTILSTGTPSEIGAT